MSEDQGTAAPTEPKEQVAILGGGIGSITAAFELTKPEYADRYDVTVYQLGWRIGGKGASGRGVNDRIEEHGLHIWFGFYENAFRLMRECAAELRARGLAPDGVDDARTAFERSFAAADRIGVTEPRDRWATWLAWFPENDLVPGTRGPEDPMPTLIGFIVRGLRLVETLVESIVDPEPTSDVRVHGRPPPAQSHHLRVRQHSDPPSASDTLSDVADRLGDLRGVLAGIELTGLIAVLEVLEMADGALHLLDDRQNQLVGLLDAFISHVEANLVNTIELTGAGRDAFEIIDLVVTIARGVIADGILTDERGLDGLDNYDFRDWLMIHGAHPIAADGGLIEGIYDLVFAYVGGEKSAPSLAAGQGVRGCFRMFFDYRGAFAYRMRGGMGDVIFSPYYEVLTARGVKFEFFHRVTDLIPTDCGKSIASVVIERQIGLESGAANYEPLIPEPVKGLKCWPNQPLWSQLDIAYPTPGLGETLDPLLPNFESFWEPQVLSAPEPITLKFGNHFDHVVFGISLASVPSVASKLITQRPEWRAMVDNLPTVQTQALQIWMDRPTADLGGDQYQPVVAGYVDNFDTWADMSEVIAHENWPADEMPQSVHYFCSVLPGPEHPPPSTTVHFPHDMYEQVKSNAIGYLVNDVGRLLPAAADVYPRDFHWDGLVGSSGQGAERLEAQFWRANINPSDRYVQSRPGTSRFRLSPGESGYDNLVLAGDWTDSGFNAGCIEAATISGLLAARAIIGDERTSDIVGFEHP